MSSVRPAKGAALQSGPPWSVTGRPHSQPGPFGRLILAVLIGVFRRVGEGGLADPGALVVGRLTLGEALGVAGAVAGYHGLELVPVDRAEVVVAARLVPAPLGVGQHY